MHVGWGKINEYLTKLVSLRSLPPAKVQPVCADILVQLLGHLTPLVLPEDK